MAPATPQSPGWKQLQESKAHLLSCRDPAQACAGITTSVRGDLAAASVVPEVNFPFALHSEAEGLTLPVAGQNWLARLRTDPAKPWHERKTPVLRFFPSKWRCKGPCSAQLGLQPRWEGAAPRGTGRPRVYTATPELTGSDVETGKSENQVSWKRLAISSFHVSRHLPLSGKAGLLPNPGGDYVCNHTANPPRGDGGRNLLPGSLLQSGSKSQRQGEPEASSHFSAAVSHPERRSACGSSLPFFFLPFFFF